MKDEAGGLLGSPASSFWVAGSMHPYGDQRFLDSALHIESKALTVGAILTRRGHEDIAMLPAAELASLKETAYLLRSPANAARLLTALARSRRGNAPEPTDLVALRAELGLGNPDE